MSETEAPLAETDLTQVSGLTLEDLTRLHAGHEAFNDDQGRDTEAEDSPVESPAARRHASQLRQALTLELAGESYQLEQQDDLKYFERLAQKTLGHTLPEIMAQLGRYLHAQEQLQILYDRLAELSEQRGTASDIMQIARQIEGFEKQLQQERLKTARLEQADQQLAMLSETVLAYRQLLQQLQKLDATDLAPIY